MTKKEQHNDIHNHWLGAIHEISEEESARLRWAGAVTEVSVDNQQQPVKEIKIKKQSFDI